MYNPDDKYLKSGYIDVDYCLRMQEAYIFLLGGRGSGKTYSVLKYNYEHDRLQFLLRRIHSEIQLIKKDAFSPYKPLNRDLGTTITGGALDQYCAVYSEGDRVVSYAAALSTIAHIRGFDASNVVSYVYDEFIPEGNARTIRGEGALYMNSYETLNRNRELEGKPPLQALFLSNTNTINSPILSAFGLVNRIQRMKEKGETEYHDKRRSIAVYLFDDSPISDRKKNTALYRAADKQSDFYKMAIGNEFSSAYGKTIRPKIPKAEYTPVCSYGKYFLLAHKDTKVYYITTSNAGGVATAYPDDKNGRKLFKARYAYLYITYLRQKVFFDSVQSELDFLDWILDK